MLQLGAINDKTNIYVYPKIANKKDNYVCVECKNKVILCKGDIIKPYFRHHILDKCYYYEKPNESQVHKDAKLALQQLFNDSKNVTIIVKCNCCNERTKVNIQSDEIKLEYRFTYNDKLKIADVAYLTNNEIKYIVEILNTHKTGENTRPEPWYELKADNIIDTINKSDDLTFNCVRVKYCDNCINNSNIECKRCNKLFNELTKNTKFIYNLCDECNNIIFDRIYLNVQFQQKDLIKTYGGMFDNQYKKWYISKSKHIDSIFKLWSKMTFVTLDNNDRIYLNISFEDINVAKYYGVKFDTKYNKWFITIDDHLDAILTKWNEIKYETFYDKSCDKKYNKKIINQLKQLFDD